MGILHLLSCLCSEHHTPCVTEMSTVEQILTTVASDGAEGHRICYIVHIQIDFRDLETCFLDNKAPCAPMFTLLSFELLHCWQVLLAYQYLAVGHGLMVMLMTAAVTHLGLVSASATCIPQSSSRLLRLHAVRLRV